VYDRRGIEYSNIDPTLYQMCRKTTDALKVCWWFATV
jgi:hypothetical protein